MTNMTNHERKVNLPLAGGSIGPEPVVGAVPIDPVVALVIASAIIVPTVQTIAGSHREMVWPENVACAHESAAPRSAELAR